MPPVSLNISKYRYIFCTILTILIDRNGDFLLDKQRKIKLQNYICIIRMSIAFILMTYKNSQRNAIFFNMWDII